jgi:cellulose biosynthesis protein BcsQ
MFGLLLNASVPAWIGKELLIAVGLTAAVVTFVAWVAIQLIKRVYRKKARKAEEDIQRLEGELTNARDVMAHHDPKLPDQLAAALDETQKLQTANAAALAEHATTREKYNTLRESAIKYQATVKKRLETDAATLAQLKESLLGADKAAAERNEELAKEQRRIQRALTKDGHTWSERVHASAPDFKPLEPNGRCTPVISILNLKGGVGKTTIAANLGAALDQLGYRLLLLDLDLQGSLTSLYLSEVQQAQLKADERLLDNFLSSSFDADFPNILDYVQPILPEQKSSIVPTTDSLAYAESNLTIRWMLREGNRDPRFLLRRELQLRRVTGKYDIILMDCPPLINVCCVNAIAASDYLLIPILPSEQATARVPVLIERIKEFRQHINPALKILGIVINRTHGSDLTSDEARRLARLQGICKDKLGEEVPQFHTFIRQTTEVRNAEDEHRTLRDDDESYSLFIDLAKEVESRLPTFARQHDAHQPAAEVAQ